MRVSRDEYRDVPIGEYSEDVYEYFSTSEAQENLGAVLGVTVGPLLGCGAYGCVLGAGDGRVVKVTTDQDEGLTWEHFRKLQQAFALRGLPAIERVVELETPTAPIETMYAVLREDIEPRVIRGSPLESLLFQYGNLAEQLGVPTWIYGGPERVADREELVGISRRIAAVAPALGQTLEQLALLDYAPYDLAHNVGQRDTGELVVFDPGGLFMPHVPPPELRRFRANAGERRVSRDEYWDLIRRASKGGTTGKQAQATLVQSDPLDVLKWTTGIAALPGGDPFDFSDWQSELRSLIPDLVKADIDDYQRIGHAPSYAQGATYELDDQQYWDGVRDLAKYTARHVDALDWPSPPKKHEIEIATAERLNELVDAHPFVADLPRILDVIRHSQNLGPALADHAKWVEDKTEISFNWEQTGKGVQFALGGIAFIALWEDTWRLLTSTGMYVPNAGTRVSRDRYWAAVKAAARGGVGPLAALDPLDVLKWTNGLPDAGGMNLLLTNVLWSLSELAKDAAQVDAAAWPGQVPAGAPADTYELTEEQYWDGVRDLLAAANRALSGYTFASSDEENEALKVELWELVSGSQQVKKLIAAKGQPAGRWKQHPFTVWPRALDTIRHSQNLQAQLTADDIPNRLDMLDMWYDGSSPATQTAIEDIAQIALWADALRMGTSAGAYVPNGIYEAMRSRGFVQSALDRGLKAWGREVAPGVVFIIENPHDPAQDIDSADVGVALVEIGPKGSEVVRRARVSLFQALSSAKALEEEFGGGRYAPNISAFSYWDHIKRIAPKVHYPPVYESDQQLMTFVAGYEDALDAMRMSAEPGMIGPWLGHVSASMQDGEKLFGALPGETDRELTVAELLLAAGRVAAVADADHWGAARQPFQSPAPPLMALDDYLRYVRDAALVVARSKNPSATFEALLDPLHTGHGTRAASSVSAHPLIARVRGDAFPYRALDVLHHTSHPEALWEDTRRRTTFAVSGDWWKAGFNAACGRSDSEEALVWLAAAAFAADVLDELGAIHLSKYAPNASAVDLVEQHGWSHALADQTLRSTGVARTHKGRLYVLTDDAGDVVPELDEPAVVGVYVEDPKAGEWVEVGQELFPSLAQALERWAEVEVDPESGVG